MRRWWRTGRFRGHGRALGSGRRRTTWSRVAVLPLSISPIPGEREVNSGRGVMLRASSDDLPDGWREQVRRSVTRPPPEGKKRAGSWA